RLPQGIQQEELARVKARATSSLVMQQESVGSRAASMARQWYHLERVMPLEEELARINRISCASIESWLSLNPPTDLTVFSLGEKALEVPSAVSA
ncbi:MAG: insulinase family protein, partial [Planctomycetota bacterium]